MELQGNLGGDEEQEVGLYVSHRLLHYSLVRMRSPAGRVNAVGRVNGGGSLLFSQASKETPHLFTEGRTERQVVELESLQFGLSPLVPVFSILRPSSKAPSPARTQTCIVGTEYYCSA